MFLIIILVLIFIREQTPSVVNQAGSLIGVTASQIGKIKAIVLVLTLALAITKLSFLCT